MSEALPKTHPVTGSEWMIAIRDYELDVTPHEFAVGSLYGTCGNWGQRVWLSDVSVEKILHIKRETVSKVRKSLLAKGLIEDIGQHGKQPSQREYRLTVPVAMPPARAFKGDSPQTDTPVPRGVTVTPRGTGDAPQTDTPCPPNGHPDAPKTDRGCPPRGAQDLDLDLDLDLQAASSAAGKNKGQSQRQRPAGAERQSESLEEQRAWIESLRSGAQRPDSEPILSLTPGDPEREPAFLGYLREHATSPETSLRPTEVFDALGMDHSSPDCPDTFIGRLSDEGVIAVGTRGWYAVQSDAA